MAERFYCPDLKPGVPIILTGDEAHHLERVRRIGVGQQIELFDGQNDVAVVAEIEEVSHKRIVARAVAVARPGRTPNHKLWLGVALPKGERLDWLVEKAVEVGVETLQPILVDRSVVDPRPAKLDRLRRHVIEASKQCGRNRLMQIMAPIRWEQWLASAEAVVKLIAHPGGLPPAEWPGWPGSATLALSVGPEGGFTDAEVDAAQVAGWLQVSLGPTLLRIETAAIVGSALIFNRVLKASQE